MLLENKEIFAAIIALIGGGFALWRWTTDQRWRRVQYTYQLVKEFMAKDNTRKALAMLDTTTEIELFPTEERREDRFAYVENDLIIRSLRIEDQNGFTAEEFAVRMIFDEFFTDLSMFQYHIEARLIRLDDVRPYLEYWVRTISGNGVVKGDAIAKDMIRFLDFFGYTAIQKLSDSMGFALSIRKLKDE